MNFVDEINNNGPKPNFEPNNNKKFLKVNNTPIFKLIPKDNNKLTRTWLINEKFQNININIQQYWRKLKSIIIIIFSLLNILSFSVHLIYIEIICEAIYVSCKLNIVRFKDWLWSKTGKTIYSLNLYINFYTKYFYYVLQY